MVKTNYQFEKRQRDSAKKQKQEEKRRQKLANKASVDRSGQEFAEDASQATPAGPDSGTSISPNDGATPGAGGSHST